MSKEGYRRNDKNLSGTARFLFGVPIGKIIEDNILDLDKNSVVTLIEEGPNKVNRFAGSEALTDMYEDESFFPTHFIFTVYKTTDIEYAQNYTPKVRGGFKDSDLIVFFHVFVKPSKEPYCEHDIMSKIKQALVTAYYSPSEGYIVTGDYQTKQ